VVENENLKQRVAELEGHVTALFSFCGSLLRETPRTRRLAIVDRFESQCEQAAAHLLGQPDPLAERQIAALELTQATIQGAFGLRASTS